MKNKLPIGRSFGCAKISIGELYHSWLEQIELLKYLDELAYNLVPRDEGFIKRLTMRSALCDLFLRSWKKGTRGIRQSVPTGAGSPVRGLS